MVTEFLHDLDRINSLGDFFHFFENIFQLFTFGQSKAYSKVSTHGTITSCDQVADARNTKERFCVAAQCTPEINHLHRTAADEKTFCILAVAQAADRPRSNS